MKITFTKDCLCLLGRFVKGDEVEASDSMCRALIENKVAEQVKEKGARENKAQNPKNNK